MHRNLLCITHEVSPNVLNNGCPRCTKWWVSLNIFFKGVYEPYQSLLSFQMNDRIVNTAGKCALMEFQTSKSLNRKIGNLYCNHFSHLLEVQEMKGKGHWSFLIRLATLSAWHLCHSIQLDQLADRSRVKQTIRVFNIHTAHTHMHTLITKVEAP